MTKDFNLSDHVLVAERAEKDIHAYMEEDVQKFLDELKKAFPINCKVNFKHIHYLNKLAGERLCPKQYIEKAEKKNTNSVKN